MMDRIAAYIKKLQQYGIPIFLLRDEKTQGPSVSLTLLIISFTLTILSLITKFTKLVDGVDVSNAMELLIITASLYFGRKISKKFAAEKDTEGK